jgi:aminocarboxymuconate-semialdehyde decarboxylase
VNVDIHSHFFPIEAFRHPAKFEENAPKIVAEKGRYSVVTRGGGRGNLAEGAYDAAARIRDLDKMGIDLQVISPSPVLLFYWEPSDVAGYFSRLQNEAIQKTVDSHPDRFIGFGCAPLQDVREAIRIAEEAKRLGLKGLEIGTNVNGQPLDDPALEPFYEAAEHLGLVLFVHPIETTDQEDPIGAMLTSVLAYPHQTTLMIERMILRGIFEKYRHLRLCLAHGGGLLPYNIGRLDHAYSQRAALKANIPHPPSSYLRQMFFDSVVHSVPALQLLIQTVGADRVVIGTDYPMAMGDRDPVPKIRSLVGVTAEERDGILGGNALAALGLKR